MADILASIRRIVNEESAPREPEGVLLLTPAMRSDGMAVLEAATPGLDEAVVADIVRAVLREELGGALGEALTARIRALVRDEVSLAFASAKTATGSAGTGSGV